MADRFVRPCHDKDDIPEVSKQPYQSSWISHWKHVWPGSRNAAGNQSSVHDKFDEEENCSKLVEGVARVTESTRINPMNESLGMSSGKLSNEPFESTAFPMFRCSRDGASALALKGRESSEHHEEVRGSRIACNSGHGVSSNRTKDCLPSIHAYVPHETEDDIKDPRICVVNEKNMNKNAALIMRDPSTSNYQSRDFVGKKLLKMPNQHDVKFFPSEVKKLENLHHDSYASKRMPLDVHDAETMRVFTTLDSAEGFSRGPQMFSQTTHHFLITKSTDVNLSGGDQKFGESTISTNLKGKTVRELLGSSPGFGFHVKQGMKLQSLDGSTKSAEKENIEDNIKTCAANSQEESSNETKTMDMDVLGENQHLCGVTSSAIEKDIEGGQKSPPKQTAATSGIEERGKLLNSELPDMKQELPVLPGSSGIVADERETSSTSRTQSLDVECLLSNAEHPAESIFRVRHERLLGLEPCSRWVKRLKPSASDSFTYGTKSSKMEEASSHGKVNKCFNEILNCSKMTLEPKMSGGKNHGPSSTDSARENDVKLSHTWIRRWCHNQSVPPKKRPERVVACEPDSSKVTPEDDFSQNQQQQFPSIAAMALMGKAMNSFRPFQFKKRGHFIVWD